MASLFETFKRIKICIFLFVIDPIMFLYGYWSMSIEEQCGLRAVMASGQLVPNLGTENSSPVDILNRIKMAWDSIACSKKSYKIRYFETKIIMKW